MKASTCNKELKGENDYKNGAKMREVSIIYVWETQSRKSPSPSIKSPNIEVKNTN